MKSQIRQSNGCPNNGVTKRSEDSLVGHFESFK
jgi:hypothetical protein